MAVRLKTHVFYALILFTQKHSTIEFTWKYLCLFCGHLIYNISYVQYGIRDKNITKL